jgi:ribonuclease BN (tRNA processing enzyme)
MMRLTVIGSGTLAPTPARVAPAHWLEAGSVRLLMDCGPGCLHRAATLGLPWADVTHVAITHFDVDHWGELPTLLYALRWGTEPARHTPLTLLGPADLEARLMLLASAFGDGVIAPDYGLHLVELAPNETVDLAPNVQLATAKTEHTPDSLAYGITHAGHRMVYTGDTGPNTTALAAWARDCDLLLTECSLPENRAMDIHLTPGQAGRLAREARAKRLVLAHLYPPVEHPDPAAIAAAAFGGPVEVARDGSTYVIE